MILLYTTHASKIEAEKITDLLLDKKLIACVNYFPIESHLIWNGVKTNENEIVALYKTSDSKAKLAEKLILENHPYDTPCVITIQAHANEKYEHWADNETNS